MIIIMRSRFQVEKSVYLGTPYGIDDECEWNITQEEVLEVSARTFCGALPAPPPSPSPMPTSTLSSFFSQSVIWSVSSIVAPTGGSELSRNGHEKGLSKQRREVRGKKKGMTRKQHSNEDEGSRDPE
jgi:hypothetical protein